MIQNVEQKKYKFERIERTPYICTVPRRGMQAVNCYEDAVILSVPGPKASSRIKFGFSARKKTLILLQRGTERGCHPLNLTKVNNAIEEFLKLKKKSVF